MELTTRPILGLSEAAAATALHRRTITRMLADGRIVGAEKDDEGRWLIPVDSLLAAGLKLHEPTSAPAEAVKAGAVVTWADLERQYLNDLAIMRVENKKYDEIMKALRSTNDAAEELVEALRSNIDDLRLQVRMLAPGSAKAAPTMPPKRLRWWHRA